MRKTFIGLTIVSILVAGFFLLSRPDRKPEVIKSVKTNEAVFENEVSSACMRHVSNLIRRVGLQSGSKKVAPVFADQSKLFSQLHKTGLLIPILNSEDQESLNTNRDYQEIINSAYLMCSKILPVVAGVCDIEDNDEVSEIALAGFVSFQNASEKSIFYESMNIKEFQRFLKDNLNSVCK